MTGLPKRLIVPIVAVLILLAVASYWMRPNLALEHSMTSFGVGAGGYKAAYELLSELKFPIKRSYLRPGLVPTHRTLWLVAPSFLTTKNERRAKRDASGLLKWARAGGTAVVFGAATSDWKRLGLKRGTTAGGPDSLVQGDFAPLPRRIAVAGLLRFAPAKNGLARVRLRSYGAPFALELKIGAGRLVAVADGRFLLNRNLAGADASNLMVDLARALGAPAFDERCHGLAAPVSLAATVLGSRAALPIAVAAIAALLWIGARRAWPPRTLAAESQAPAPTVAAFVESLGVLYSRAGDPAAVFRAYRAGFLRRAGRRLSPGGGPEIAPEPSVLARLARDPKLPPEARPWLLEGIAPKNDTELLSAVRAIESYPIL